MQTLLYKHSATVRKLFSDNGIKNISMDDIANSLHISKKTIYKEYRCKDELVKDIYLNDYYHFKASIYSLELERIDVITKTICIYNSLRGKFFSIRSYELFDLEKYYPSLLNELVALHRESTKQSLIGILSEGKADNYFHNDIKPESIARLFSFLFESYVLYHRPESKEEFTLSWIDVLDYHFRSICNPIGLDRWEIIKTQNLKSQSDDDDKIKNMVRCRI